MCAVWCAILVILWRTIPSLKFINTVKEGKEMLTQLLSVAVVTVEYLG